MMDWKISDPIINMDTCRTGIMVFIWKQFKWQFSWCPDECSISMREGQHAQGQCDGHRHTLQAANQTKHGDIRTHRRLQTKPNMVVTNFSLPVFLPSFPGLQSLPQDDPGKDGCWTDWQQTPSSVCKPHSQHHSVSQSFGNPVWRLVAALFQLCSSDLVPEHTSEYLNYTSWFFINRKNVFTIKLHGVSHWNCYNKVSTKDTWTNKYGEGGHSVNFCLCSCQAAKI